MTENYVLARVEWRKSSFSGGGGDYGADCVEVASLADGSIAVRDSKCPAAGAIRFARADLDIWVKGLKAARDDG
ncbi:MAG: DUF397 domain-containing protein [Actinomycetota bacterium]|nr:DUF397 domain-containing protein [Actinomycetota bacterium]